MATDLLTGVLVGIGLSIAKLLYACTRLSVQVRSEPECGRTELVLRGAATFLRLPWLARAIEQFHPTAMVHLNYAGLIYIDHACLELLHNWERQHISRGGTLVVDWELLYARFQRPYRAPEPSSAATPAGNGKSDRHSLWSRVKLTRKS